MMKPSLPSLSLHVDASEPFLSVATAFVEKSALAFGLGKPGTLALTLATEEVFAHLYRVALPQGGGLKIACAGGGYHVKVEITLPQTALNLRAFNLTSSVSEAEDAWDEMGLVLASRLVDRFSLETENGSGMRLTFIKDKDYPSEETLPRTSRLPESAERSANFTLREPYPEELKHLVRQLGNEDLVLPDFFRYPGKLVEMVDCGEYSAMVAVAPDGHLGGGILWHWCGGKTVECFGPYLFAASETLAWDLLESCIGRIARTKATGLISRFPSPSLPLDQFEPLGQVVMRGPNGAPQLHTAQFRHLDEDLGSLVRTHPDLVDFLEAEYDRLVLPREVHSVPYSGETLDPHSVISAEFDRHRGMVTLRPAWPGADVRENVARHVELIRQEHLPNLFFELDLGQPWQSGFVPSLLQSGFAPKYILPSAGKGDLVLFQREAL